MKIMPQKFNAQIKAVKAQIKAVNPQIKQLNRQIKALHPQIRKFRALQIEGITDLAV